MLIKEENGKINFIDKNDNFVGFDYEQCCCESFGYYFSTKKKSVEPDNEPSSEGFYFDTSVEPYSVDSKDGDADSVAFKCKNDDGDVIYLHLYNSHNGYYSHGWDTSFGYTGYL